MALPNDRKRRHHRDIEAIGERSRLLSPGSPGMLPTASLSPPVLSNMGRVIERYDGASGDWATDNESTCTTTTLRREECEGEFKQRRRSAEQYFVHEVPCEAAEGDGESSGQVAAVRRGDCEGQCKQRKRGLEQRVVHSVVCDGGVRLKTQPTTREGCW